MLSFIKKIFGSKPAEEVAPVAPYKLDAAEAPASAPVVEAQPAKAPKAKTSNKSKKPSVKKATTRKPKAPKQPK